MTVTAVRTSVCPGAVLVYSTQSRSSLLMLEFNVKPENSSKTIQLQHDELSCLLFIAYQPDSASLRQIAQDLTGNYTNFLSQCSIAVLYPTSKHKKHGHHSS